MNAERVVLIGAVLALTGLSVAYAVKSAEARAGQLEARNARAEADVTHGSFQRLHGHMAAVSDRLVEEHQVRLSAAQAEIAGIRREKATADAQIKLLGDSLHRQHAGAAVTVTEDGTITAADTLDATDSLGVKASATVRIPPMDSTGARPRPTWTWDLSRAEVNLDLTLTCADRNARAHLSGPPWLRTDLTRVQQDDRICVPATTWSPFSVHVPSMVESAVAAGLFLFGVCVGGR